MVYQIWKNTGLNIFKLNINMHRKKAFLLDGTSFCYRAHYAIKSLSNSSGRPTNAIYGFVMMLNKIIESESPDYLAVAFDVKAKTFRHQQYKDYKANRPPMPDELSSQLPVIKDVLSGYGIPIYELAGYEGEDIIATITEKLKKNNIDVFIATGDKDIMQLIDDEVKMYNTNKDGQIYDVEGVKGKFGVEPNKVIEVMALTGDKTDNVPGVPGIGPKTALGLISEYSSVNNLIKNADGIENKRIAELIIKNKDNALLSKELVTINKNVPLKINIEDLQIKKPDNNKLFEIYKELEFRNLLKTFAPETKNKTKYILLQGVNDLKKFIVQLKKQKLLSFDFETDSPNPHMAVPVGIAFSYKEDNACYLSLAHGDYRPKGAINVKEAMGLLKDVLEDKNIKKVGQNIKYEYIILKRYGIELKGIYFDTMVASYVLNPSKANHNLDDISLEHLGHKMITYSELVKKDKKKENAITEVPLAELVEYACEDADITYRLHEVLKDKLIKMSLWKLYGEIEMPLIEVLASMEINGVSINEEKLKKLSKDLAVSIGKIKTKIIKTAGVEFNINSPKQLSGILFDKLKLPIIKKTKTGASTDVEVLEKLSDEHELPGFILKYRELAKIQSTYTDALCSLKNPKTGKIHTSYNQTVTQTGRLSSSNPNLQNIPIRSDLGKRIREAFIPSENDYSFLSADYSQIELRVLAHLSHDKVLEKAFRENLDVHSYTASLVYDVDLKDVTPKMRSMAKTVNFSVIYGVSAFGLSRDLHISIKEAKEFIDNYFKRYPEVKAYIDMMIKEAKAEGYVKTLFGRRRYIPQIKSSNIQQVNFGKRIAINMPVQGTASDLMKIAMINIYHKLINKSMKSKMVLQIHDELIFEVENNDIEQLKKMVKDEMENVVKLDVPIIADLSIGKNWAEC